MSNIANLISYPQLWFFLRQNILFLSQKYVVIISLDKNLIEIGSGEVKFPQRKKKLTIIYFFAKSNEDWNY